MKKMIVTVCASVLTACALLSPVMIPTNGPVMRQVQRVVERHDAYVGADKALSAEKRVEFLAESESVRSLMVSMPDGVPAEMLSPRLDPVMTRHDVYVGRDLDLDPLARDSYLASTMGLRDLILASMAR